MESELIHFPEDGQYFMRLALFALVNAIVAGFLGVYAFFQGKSAGEIVLIVVLTLVVLQVGYVFWLVAVSLLRQRDETPESDTAAPAPARRLSRQQSVPGNQPH